LTNVIYEEVQGSCIGYSSQRSKVHVHDTNININKTSLLVRIQAPSLETLGVISIAIRAGRSRGANGAPSPGLSTTLTILGLSASGRSGGLSSGVCSTRGPGGGGGGGASAELALDEGQSLLAVLCTIALMSVGVTSSAAVRIRSVAVGLDLGCRWA